MIILWYGINVPFNCLVVCLFWKIGTKKITGFIVIIIFNVGDLNKIITFTAHRLHYFYS